MQTKVSIGITTIIGYLVFAAGVIPILISLLETGSSDLSISGPEKWSALIALVSLAVTQIGRYLQAHALIKAGR
jgi:hypothetical protein